MYHEFYGLRQAPFKITPDTRLFYPGGSRGEILEALVYAIVSGEGIVKVVGEVGSGKTMLCRMLEVRLPDEVEIVYLPNPSLTPEDILHNIALEMGIKVDPAANRIHVMQDLHQCLLERHAENRRVVVFVEEAQAMPLETLEEIRLLSNLETQRDKLLQIVLFGQPELNKNLNVRSIRQLRERITHSFGLPPLNADDVRDYVRFRLNAVGYRGPDMFDHGAYKAIALASRGLTRRVNILADKSLLAAFAENTHNVSRKHALKAIADSELKVRRHASRPLMAAAAGVVGLAMVFGIVLSGVLNPAFDKVALAFKDDAPEVGLEVQGGSVSVASVAGELEGAQPAEPRPVETASTAELPQSSAIVEVASTEHGAAGNNTHTVGNAPSAAGDSSTAPAGGANHVTAESFDGTVGTTTLAEVSVPAQIAIPKELVQAVDDGAVGAPSEVAAAKLGDTGEFDDSVMPVGTDSPSAAEAKPVLIAVVETAAKVETPAKVETTQVAVASKARSSVAVESSAVTETVLEPLPADANLVEQRLSAARSWLSAANKSYFTIQLLATDARQGDSLERFLRDWRAAGRLERVYIFRTKINGSLWFGVLYDDYKTLAEAQAALKRLPPEVKRYKPFIRNVRDIRNLG